MNTMTYLGIMRGLSLTDGAELNEGKDVHLLSCK
jgi:hypothetical protein